MATKTIEGVIGLVGTAASNFINQINDGTNVHDLAVKSGITFFPGNNGEGIKWDGTQAIEVVIPSVTDIVQDPVRMVGTVGSDGQLPAGLTPAKGDLLYITADCTFQGVACEAGDMAIYDGTAWRVVSGENQVAIVGVNSETNRADVLLTGTAQSVLTVEGKTLTLAVDYADVLAKTKVTKNAAVEISVLNGTVTVASKYIKLTQGESSSVALSGTDMSINLPTALASGLVTISDKVLQDSDFTWDAGTLPSISMNSAAINVTASHSMSIGKLNANDGATGDYVTDVTAIKGVSLVAGTSSDNSIAFVSGLTANTGASFVKDIHTYDSSKDSKIDFTVYQAVAASDSNTFATGWGAEAASGEVVSSVSVGTVTIGEGSDVVTGLASGNAVVSSVDFGTLGTDTSKEWFVSSLNTTGSDVVTDVTVGAVSIIADNSSSFASNAMVSASVNNHVLTFNTGSFMTPVKLSKAADTITKGGFVKSGVQLSGTSAPTTTLVKGGISQAETSVSYKSLATGAVTLTHTELPYSVGVSAATTYAPDMSYLKISTTAATMSKNSPALENTDITATIAAGAVAVGMSAGTLPSLTIGTASKTISGTVGTSLSVSEVTWKAVNTDETFDVPGAYSLAVGASTDEDAIAVGAEGDYNVENAKVTIAANNFVTDVYVNDSVAGVKTGA